MSDLVSANLILQATNHPTSTTYSLTWIDPQGKGFTYHWHRGSPPDYAELDSFAQLVLANAKLDLEQPYKL
jgi:hypothetical protein